MESILIVFLSALGIVVVACGAHARMQRPDGRVGWCRACRSPVHGETPRCSVCDRELSGRGLRLSLPPRRPGLIIIGVRARPQRECRASESHHPLFRTNPALGRRRGWRSITHS